MAQLLWMSRLATGFWGLFASVVAIYAANLGSLIEVVNRFGSYLLRLDPRRVHPGDRVPASERPRCVRRACSAG